MYFVHGLALAKLTQVAKTADNTLRHQCCSVKTLIDVIPHHQAQNVDLIAVASGIQKPSQSSPMGDQVEPACEDAVVVCLWL